MSKVRRDHWKRKGGKQRLSSKSGCEYTESAAKKMGCGNSPRLQQPSEVANNSCSGYCEGPPPSGLSDLLVETVLFSPTFYIIAWTRGGWQRFKKNLGFRELPLSWAQVCGRNRESQAPQTQNQNQKGGGSFSFFPFLLNKPAAEYV